ncbi:MAG: TM2 domain-containing protein [Chloroflexi bacterium]|nr:TM2 domain-containing protein [Chloroflexota bacterium]
MIKCPACGTENAEGSNFCIACGIDLTVSAVEQNLRTDSAAAPTPETPPLTSPSVDMPREYLESPPPPPPPPPYVPPPPMYSPPVTPSYSASQPAKDRTIALVIEVAAGLFGFLGIGWMYAGNVSAGLIWLIGFWVGNIIGIVLDLLTVGFFTCIHVPLAIACLPVSAYLLYNYTKQHPEVFGP